MSGTCFHCGAPATKLCDFHIGQVIGGFVRVGPVEAGRWMAVTTMKNVAEGKAFYTCDRSLCDACAIDKGRIFICGPNPSLDTYDYCRDHAAAGSDRDAPMLLEHEADAIRYRLHLRLTPPRGKAALVK